MGNPPQAKATEPVKLFCEVTEIWVNPTVPGSMVSEGSETLRFIAGVWPAGLTVKETVTGKAAAKYRLSPGCEAVMVQVLAEVTLAKVATEPLTVHTDGVLDEYMIGNPEVVVAVSVNVVPPT